MLPLERITLPWVQKNSVLARSYQNECFIELFVWFRETYTGGKTLVDRGIWHKLYWQQHNWDVRGSHTVDDWDT
jgi:hypothetical protein